MLKEANTAVLKAVAVALTVGAMLRVIRFGARWIGSASTCFLLLQQPILINTYQKFRYTGK